MNKNISTHSFLLATCTAVWLGIFALPHTETTKSAVAQLSGSNLILKESNPIALNLPNRDSKIDSNKIILFMSLVGIGALFWSISQSRKGSKPNFQAIETGSSTALLDRVKPKLRRQLLRLINDPKTVNRLLMGIHQNNRDRSPNWIAEKAIYDLRRGR